jgi:hypothetical protein
MARIITLIDKHKSQTGIVISTRLCLADMLFTQAGKVEMSA